MELSDIGSLVNAVPGLQGKVAYRAFPVGEAPALPFVTYLERSQEPFAADNAAYYVSSTVDIELYTEIRDETTEGLLEAALRDASLIWTKTIDYLDSERCFMIVYTVSI